MTRTNKPTNNATEVRSPRASNTRVGSARNCGARNDANDLTLAQPIAHGVHFEFGEYNAYRDSMRCLWIVFDDSQNDAWKVTPWAQVSGLHCTVQGVVQRMQAAQLAKRDAAVRAIASSL